MYLRRFAGRVGSNKKPKIRCIEPKADPPRMMLLSVENAAVETDLYMVETHDARSQHIAEHLFGVFESAAGYAFANLDKDGNHFPDEIDRRNLSLFFALQLVRGHDMGDFQTRLYTEVAKGLMRFSAERPEYVRRHLSEQGDDDSDEAVAQMVDDLREGTDDIKVVPHKNETVAAIMTAPPDLMPYFFRRRWFIMRSGVPLLTTDRPIVLMGEPKSGHLFGDDAGVMNARSIIYVLDRHRVLVMKRPDLATEEGLGTLSPEAASTINRTVASAARRWIFHHPDDEPLKRATYVSVPGSPPHQG